MIAEDPSTVSGTVDRDGRLLSADPRLLALQLGAGGEVNGVLAVPQLASLARLARTLGVVVSRGVVAADRDVDLDLWVRAQPEGETVRLSIAGWTERAPPVPAPEHLAQRARDLSAMGSDGEWATDSALRLMRLDPRLARLVTGEWRGERLTRVFKLEPAETGDFALHDAVLEGQAFSGQKVLLRAETDIELWLHGAPAKDEAGAIPGYSGGFRWASVPHDLIADDQPVGGEDPHFVDRLDGALRRPLARIIAQADEIAAQAEGPIKEDYAGYAGDIAGAGRHLLGLVDDLSDLQAVERTGFAVETERLDLADVARRAASLLGVRAGDSKVRIDAPDTDEILWAKADFRRALQIMVNLVGNAVRYSPEGSMIWIRAEQEGDIAALIVADQGKGIAVADQERIFEKFERVDPSEPGGSGLGLYISRRLARAMGGDISVDSAPGLGARFILTLPAAAPSSPD
jgi:two-component sensor histidine kinase